MESNRQPVTIRRNAKQASCEPCRISKVRCSHEIPCSRCIRNGRPEECIIHPAPMTRRATTSSTTPASPGALWSAPTPPTFEIGSSARYPRNLASHVGFGSVRGISESPLFLEQSALCNVWEELDSQSDFDAAGDLPTPKISPKLRQFCRVILAWMPSGAVAKNVLNEYLESSPDVTRSMLFQHQLEDFFSSYGQLLEEPKSAENVAILADRLCTNTSQELSIPSTNSEWIEQLSGPQTRWQAVGEIFVTLGLAAHLGKGNGPKFSRLIPPNMSPREYEMSMLECADACLLLCDKLDPNSNMLTAQLFLRCVVLQLQLTGDASYGLWKRSGALMHAITGLGMHRELQVNHSVAPMYDAQRSRVFARAFILDKALATFCGRPPALNRQYVSVKFPLDLDDSEIMYGNPEYFQAQLDSSGWNKGGGTRIATQIRAEMTQSVLRDEILELTLTRANGVSLRVQDLRTRVEQAWQDLPLRLRIPLDKSVLDSLDEWQIRHICLLRLNHLQNIFLLERIQHEEQDQQKLRMVATEILKTIMWQWNNREASDNGGWDGTNHFISYYGVPAASALAMDLWKQTTTSVTQAAIRDRPQVIHELSMFLSCLDWVESAENPDGNFALCLRLRKTINYILSRILEPTVGTSEYPDLSQYLSTSTNAEDSMNSDIANTDWSPLDGGWERDIDELSHMHFSVLNSNRLAYE